MDSSPSKYGPRSSSKRSSVIPRLLRCGTDKAPVESPEGGRGPALYRPQRDAGPAGDLALRESFEVRKNQYLPKLIRDARERPGDVPTVHPSLGLGATGHVSKRFLAGRQGP